MKHILSVLFIFVGLSVMSQTVYRTPSGKKYHNATCRLVKNTSSSLSIESALSMGLSACKQCKPGRGSAARSTSNLGTKPEKAQGERLTAVRCKGTSKSGVQCKRKTKNKNS